MFALFTEWVVLVPDFKYASNSCRERPFQTNFRWTESKFKKKKWQTKKKEKEKKSTTGDAKVLISWILFWMKFILFFCFLLVFLKNFCLAFDIIIWCCYFLIIYTQVDFMLRKSASMCVMTCPSVMKRRPYLCNDIGLIWFFNFIFPFFILIFLLPPFKFFINNLRLLATQKNTVTKTSRQMLTNITTSLYYT